MTSKKYLDPEVVRIVTDLQRRGWSTRRIIEFYTRSFAKPISIEVINRIRVRTRLIKNPTERITVIF